MPTKLSNLFAVSLRKYQFNVIFLLDESLASKSKLSVRINVILAVRAV